MTEDKAHEVYKELSTALNDLSRDMVKGLVALRAVASDNKSDIERVERRLDQALGQVQEKLDRLLRAEGVNSASIEALQKSREAEQASDKAVRVEHTKGRWAFWVAVAGGATGVVSAIAQLVASAFGH